MPIKISSFNQAKLDGWLQSLNQNKRDEAIALIL